MDTITKVNSKCVSEYVSHVLGFVQEKFAYKNGNYASDDAFHNFRQTAVRIYGSDNRENMFRVLMTYMDKHLCTLAKNGFDDAEFVDRFEDVIVYSCLALAMYRLLHDD